MAKESWFDNMKLGHIDYVGRSICNITKFTESEMVKDEFYGPYLKISGYCYMAPYLDGMCFGEYGALAFDGYYKDTVFDDFEFLAKQPETPEDARRQVLCLNFIKYMARINKGRKIDGKTYEETFVQKAQEFWKKKRKAAHDEVDRLMDSNVNTCFCIAKNLYSVSEDERK